MGRTLSPPDVARIIGRAAESPGVSAGVCPMDVLLKSRSWDIYHPIPFRPDGIFKFPIPRPDWPNVHMVLVYALYHPQDQPELDWWDGRDTEGNRRLRRLGKEMRDWLLAEYEVESWPLVYHPENGGLFLKEAAAAAGLGVIGRNNLFLSPNYGPRVRLRALALNAAPNVWEPAPAWDPCGECAAPCLTACPSGALNDGGYNREKCLAQMGINRTDCQGASRIRYCRRCELACPIGKRQLGGLGKIGTESGRAQGGMIHL